MEYPKHRFEFFSDGIMAIIMTIMVLEIPVSMPSSIDDIQDFVKPILIFFVSFFIVAWFLYQHHHIISHTAKITNRIFWKNILFLFFVALVPLFTKLVIENNAANMAIIAYNIVFLMANISFLILRQEAKKQISEEMSRIIKERHCEMRKASGKRFIFIMAVVWVILLGLVVSSILYPKISLILYIGFPIIFAFSNMLVEHDPNKMHAVRKNNAE